MKRFESKDGTVVVTVDGAGVVCITDGTGDRAPVVMLTGELAQAPEAMRDLDEVIRLLKRARAYLVERGMT